MLNLSENYTVTAIILIALVIIIWGYNRSSNYGEIGKLARLQSLALMTPWLLFFLLFAMGISLNLIGVIFLLVISSSFYIYLGNKIRTKSQEKISKSQPQKEQLDSFASPEILSNINLEIDNKKESQEDQSTPNLSELKTSKEFSSSSDFSKQVIKPDLQPIDDDELNQIKNIFSIDTFFATSTIPYQEGAIFKGKLRGEANFTHAELT